MKLALTIILLVGLCLIASSAAQLLDRPPQAGAVRVQPATATERPIMIVTATDDQLEIASRQAQATLTAGQAELIILAVKATDTAIGLAQDAAQRASAATDTRLAYEVSATREADSARVQVAQLQSASTAQAASTMQAVSATQIAATLIALAERVENERASGKSEREFIPWVNAWDFVWPIVTFMVAVGVIVVLIFSGADLVKRAAELRMIPYTQPELAEVAEFDDDDEPAADQPAPRIDIQIGTQTRRLNLPCTDAQLFALATGVMAGAGLTDDEWIDNGFTAQQWPLMRDALVARGLAVWRSTATRERGARWTALGLQTMQQIAGKTE